MVVFGFRQKLLQQCRPPWRWILSPAGVHLPIHCLSTLYLTDNFVCCCWKHMAAHDHSENDKEKGVFLTWLFQQNSVSMCHPTIPGYQEKYLAKLLRHLPSSCWQDAQGSCPADERRRGSSICRGAWEEENRMCKGRCVETDWQWGRTEHWFDTIFHELPGLFNQTFWEIHFCWKSS